MRYDEAIKDWDLPKNEAEATSLTSRVMSHADAGQNMLRYFLPKEALSTV
jgi:hypothetical protein